MSPALPTVDREKRGATEAWAHADGHILEIGVIKSPHRHEHFTKRDPGVGCDIAGIAAFVSCDIVGEEVDPEFYPVPAIPDDRCDDGGIEAA